MSTATSTPSFVLVIVHPAWPWQFPAESRSDRLRFARYRMVLERALAFRGPILLIDKEAPVVDDEVRDLVSRLRNRATFTAIDAGDTADSLRDAACQLNDFAIREFTGRRVVLGGFYRNLCVKFVQPFIKNSGIDASISPARII